MTEHTFPLIEVSGGAYQLGYEHGAQAADLVQKYLLWIERMTGKSRDLLCQNAMAFLPMMEKLSPAFVEEVRGLADVADISFEEAVLCQAPRRSLPCARGGMHSVCIDGFIHSRWSPLGGSKPRSANGIRGCGDSAARQADRWTPQSLDIYLCWTAWLRGHEPARLSPFCQCPVRLPSGILVFLTTLSSVSC